MADIVRMLRPPILRPMRRWSAGDAVFWRTGSAQPLDEPWARWRPDPSWPLATLSDGWDIA